MITPISSINGISPITSEDTVDPNKELYEPGESIFGTIFESAIENVKDTNTDFVQNQYLLATGQLDNPSTLMIAATKYQISVNLLIQLRNKALDAYSEISRMSI